MVTSTRSPEIDVTPAKRFFVEMLTRDIELEDAVLDLLDNCVDGALRSNSKKKRPPARDSVYKGFEADIVLSRTHFRISDNCGGIPLTVAKDYAFKFGRPRAGIDENLHTVGVYGIGMKRALFKLGTDCRVWSQHAEGAFNVHMDQKWLSGDSWTLAMRDSMQGSGLSAEGVAIEVKDLHPTIADMFDPQTGGFEETLVKKIRDHYAYIIQKGFRVKVNGRVVQPVLIQTLMPENLRGKQNKIAPYIYETEHDGVAIRLTMGMYAQFPSEAEVDELNEGRRSKNTAGWTIVCNDRVVLSHDTSHRTGWGEAGVPAYHSQFVMLAGVVEFSSSRADKLPVTTTKRGINLDSPLYASVKDVMREALKHFTSFTYHWKSDSGERVDIQRATKAVDIRQAAAAIPAEKWQDVRKNLKGRKFVPELPKPAHEKTHARISFERELQDIEALRTFFELESSTKPAEVGASAFDWALSQAQS